ncbi:hypothetical protein F511_44639 [Dorcoceras hygrometricum]|uniref:Uncharacterized protein n=1 Tax=Dorcoceras hygrometricum TaxID=472368 RepID=A0A2Z7CAM8_9LAMI|nr:hypothetical protein F511_44639 [Dorcoceras hygrometricum]
MGPISYIGPKTSRAARDRPEQNPRKKSTVTISHGIARPARVSRGNRHFTVGGGRLRQSGPRSEGRLLRQPALEGLTRSAWTDSPRKVGRNKFRVKRGGGGGGF